MVIRELVTKWGFDADTVSLKNFERGIKGAKESARSMGIVLGAVAAATGFFAKRAGEVEQIQIAFDTMLGSAEKGKKLFEDITNFASTTPFELLGLVESSKKLLAFGFEADNIVQTLTTLGNITAGIGTDKMPRLILALGKVKASTRLTGEELKQFTEAGVPLLTALGKQFNVTEKAVFDLVRQGKVGFEDVNSALTDMANGGGMFANLMIKQSKSFLGLMSNLKDFFEILSFQIGQELLPALKDISIQTLEYLNANRKLLSLKIGGFFKEFVMTVSDVIDSMGGIGNTLKVLGIGIAAAFVLFLPKLALAAVALLIIQDIIAGFKDQDSILGGAIDAWTDFFNIIAKGLNKVINLWNMLPDPVKSWITFSLGGGFKSLNAEADNNIPTLPTYTGSAFFDTANKMPQNAGSTVDNRTNIEVNLTGSANSGVAQEIAQAIDEKMALRNRELVRHFDKGLVY